MSDNVVNKKAVFHSLKVDGMSLSSSRRKQVTSSQVEALAAQQQGIVSAPNIVVTDAGVMPLPNVIKYGVVKAGFDNLDNAEYYSQIAS